MQLKEYVGKYFDKELRIVSNSFRSEQLTVLNNHEKTLVYKYSEDFYEGTNERLRVSKGKDVDDFSSYLIKSLKKLPNYKLICYRSANLSSTEIRRYRDAFKKNIGIIEYSFVSCSKSRMLANMFSPANVIFIIHSKTGKEIEKIAKFGIKSGQNEKEVLFIPNTNFEVLNITQKDGKELIYLQEK